MPEKLLFIPWFAGILYGSIPFFWLAIHPLAGRWQKMQRSPYRVLLPLWAVMIAVLGGVTLPWQAQRIYTTWWAWLPAFPFFWMGLRTYSSIPSAFGMERLSGQAELRPDGLQQSLVVSGLHARMRHPIYFAHLCNLAGWTLGSGLVVNYGLLAVSCFLTFPLMIWLEERELIKRFGPDYLDYRKAVSAFPGLMPGSYKSSPHANTASPLRKR
jgi:protein-S-isoprenylcysteine O-methyltransferase Ste14